MASRSKAKAISVAKPIAKAISVPKITNQSIQAAWKKALNKTKSSQPKPSNKNKNTTQLDVSHLLARFIPHLTKDLTPKIEAELTPKIEQKFHSEITELKAKNEELEINLADCKLKLNPVNHKKTMKKRSRHPKFNSYHTPHVYQTGPYE